MRIIPAAVKTKESAACITISFKNNGAPSTSFLVLPCQDLEHICYCRCVQSRLPRMLGQCCFHTLISSGFLTISADERSEISSLKLTETSQMEFFEVLSC